MKERTKVEKFERTFSTVFAESKCMTFVMMADKINDSHYNKYDVIGFYFGEPTVEETLDCIRKYMEKEVKNEK